MKKLIATLFAALISASAMADSSVFSDYPAIGGSLGAGPAIGNVEHGLDMHDVQGWVGGN